MGANLRRVDIDAIFASEAPRRAFATIEARLLGEIASAEEVDARGRVLEALEASFAGPALLTPEWLAAICDASPNYLRPRGAATTNFAIYSAEARLCALLIGALLPLAREERGALVCAVIPSLADISLLCALLCRIDRGEFALDRSDATPAIGFEASGAGSERGLAASFFASHIEAARSGLFERIASLASSGGIWTQDAPASILWFWFTSGQEQEAYLFVKRSMQDPRTLGFVLELALEPGDAGHEIVAVRRWSKIIDFNTLETRAVELLMSSASRADRSRARRFLDAFAQGKSDLFR